MIKLFAQGWSRGKDGPGNRRIYYLKGCNLRCQWCASPESISPEVQLLFYPERNADFSPDVICPQGAICNGKLNREICTRCQDRPCAKLRHPAIEWVGFQRTPEEIVREVSGFAENWGDFSGVTFGGGEPTLQYHELVRTMQLLQGNGIHVAFESNATTPGFHTVASCADMTIADLKAGTPETFEKYTGGDLSVVLNNLTFAAAGSKELLIRIPVITGINDTQQETDAMVKILQKLHRVRTEERGIPLAVELLKLHHFGAPKYRALGWEYKLEGRPEPDVSVITELEKQLSEQSIEIQRN